MSKLSAFDWPGNVRELSNVVERHVALASGQVIKLDEIPDSLVASSTEIDADHLTLVELEHFNGNRTETARALGIDKSTL